MQTVRRPRTIINQHLFCSTSSRSLSFVFCEFIRTASSSPSIPSANCLLCCCVRAAKKAFKESYLGLNNSFGSFSPLGRNIGPLIHIFLMLTFFSFSCPFTEKYSKFLFLLASIPKSASLSLLLLLFLIFRLFVGGLLIFALDFFIWLLCTFLFYDYFFATIYHGEYYARRRRRRLVASFF